MALTPGTRLGVYDITAPIGEGGMGQVYRARDTRLDRDIAIKILPEAFAHDADRLARFQREAKTLASLNHPHIASIYGLEESGGVSALVMELVEGEDLSQRIMRGAIPLDEALPIAKQIADALEAAHEQGIIHRDLKPANIKVRGDATVKVLDFGLAKAVRPAAAISVNVAMSPTMTTPAMSHAGMILGTAAYMSPEQARGRTVDKRADIWAFGVVLWEMLTGKRLFEGATASDTIAAVLRAEPDWAALPANTPAPIHRLLRRCLEKDPTRRLDSASVCRLEIEDALAAAPALHVGVGSAVTSASRRNASAPWLLVAALAGLLAATLLFGVRSGGRQSSPLANAVPVVVLMDTSAPEGVYDPQTRKNSGTNADDISDALASLPVALHKEAVSASWNREDQIIKQNPDLVVIHRSAFAHAMVLEFQQGYSTPSVAGGAPTSSRDLPPSRATLYDRLNPFGWDKLEAFIGYVGGVNPRTRFLVYTRGLSDEAARVAWEQGMVRRFPTLKDRLSGIHIAVRDGTASFRDPQTVEQVRQAVRSLLGLRAPSPRS